jgi:hypothetical protein
MASLQHGWQYEPALIHQDLILRPDAVFLPETLKTGSRIFDRIRSICKIAELLLEVDFPRERAYIRKQLHGRLFITRDPTDTILFATSHPRSGQQRYRWERQADGVELGYLVSSE